MTQTSDAFGSLTALFTSDAASANGAGVGSDIAAVAIVLVGNLPVNAGLWTTQLADEIARHAGPTALVRYERGEVTVELLRAEGRTLPASGPDALAGWLPRGAAMVRRWVICVPAESSPGDVLAAGGDLLLMTGADEAAVVHAYHRLKHLADEANNRGEPLGRVGLVVVGAPDDRVEAVAAKLGEAARSFLGIELTVAARLPKLGRVESSARVAYPSGETPSLGELVPALARARAEAGERFDADHAALPVSATPVAAAHAEVAHTAPAPAAARFVSYLAGLRPLGISCPTVPDVELALDDAGRLHIVGRSDHLARVRAAHTWATQHQQLLGMAFPELARHFRVMERLVLTDAREAIGLHGTGVLLDLLVQVNMPSGPIKAVVSLNDAATSGANAGA